MSNYDDLKTLKAIEIAKMDFVIVPLTDYTELLHIKCQLTELQA